MKIRLNEKQLREYIGERAKRVLEEGARADIDAAWEMFGRKLAAENRDAEMDRVVGDALHEAITRHMSRHDG